mmetsp:Transcript_17414/g.22012  ORF Transcript_17414/g.22012 Transcript_17414/m.22012 type:complete len:119 (+) Transcript_17414:89-445(+)
MDMGAGSGSSAISEERTDEKRANRLHMPNAVVSTSGGNKPGIERYDNPKAIPIPNLASMTNTAIRAPSALKKITSRQLPLAANPNAIMKEILTPSFFMRPPSIKWDAISAVHDKAALT